MKVSALKLLLNLYPDDLDVVVSVDDQEYDEPCLKVFPIITTQDFGRKCYFKQGINEESCEDGETIEEVLIIN